MSFRSIVRDVRDGFGSLSRRSFDVRLHGHHRGKSHGSFHELPDQPLVIQSSRWANLPLELLCDVIKRLEESESNWPARKHVVACAAVCRSWRSMCKEIVRSPEFCGKLTFPVSLKQPGPRDGFIQCFIKRDKSNLTYHLFLCLSPALLVENGKFLLSAKRTRRTTCTEYVISMDADNISRSSSTYIGKLRSNFLGTKFIIYDTQPSYTGACVPPPGRTSRRFYSKKVSPKVPTGSYNISQITYELNVLGTRGPRKMNCIMHSIPAAALDTGGTVPGQPELVPRSLEDSFRSISFSKSLDHSTEFSSSRFSEIVRIPPATEQSPDFVHSNSWICKNAACRAVLSIEDTFCKRCSCCICHLFDDNKDPSLWLVCTSESGNGDSCGLSCHIECALQREKVGVVDLGQLMQLDGSYCCASCGKVSGILGCWKKQLSIAKDARRVDALCYRIFLSYRLLDGTSRFQELHEIVRDAKARLETEVGPVNGVSAKMARGIVSRLSIAGEIQKLCCLAIEKADEWLATVSNTNPNHREGSLPAACRFHFEEVTSSSVVIVLIELQLASNDDIKGYKLWYCKSRDETHPKEPICVFPRAQRRILISNLQPCTEYSFRIISYTEAGDLGHSEAKCFTKSVEIIHKDPNSAPMNCKNENLQIEGSSNAQREPKTTTAVESSSGFKVRDLGKILRLAWAQEQGCFEGFSGIDIEECCQVNNPAKPLETPKDQLPPVSRGLDLNVASVPDLNEELTPPFESSRDEDNDDAVSHDIEKNRSHGSGDSQNWTHGANGEVPDVDSEGKLCRKRAASTNEETHDCDSTLINGSPFRIGNESGCLDENFEYCVKIIRWLECEGHIKLEFRLKLLTWFSLRSTEQERRVVNTFIQTMIDDPSSLAAQLVDSFSDIISSKRPRNGFCSKLWH